MKLLHGFALVAALLVSACTSELAATGSTPESPEKQAVRYRLVAVPLEETSPSARNVETPPFKLLAPFSGRARIVDKDGKEIRRAPEGRSIGEMKISPNRQWVLLDFGDAKYAVASVDGLKDIARPPTRPNAPTDATGFSWRILDDDRLIGSAELPSLEPTEGLTASEADGLPPRGSLVYIYTMATGAMTPVEIDDSVPRPFGISTDSYGNLVISPLMGPGGVGDEGPSDPRSLSRRA